MNDTENTPISTRKLPPETAIPEFNVLERMENDLVKLFYLFEQVTAPSRMPSNLPDNAVSRAERSLLQRKLRAEIYQKIKSPKNELSRHEIKTLFREADVREKIAGQFLHQQEITIGQDSARFVELNSVKETDHQLPPIILIPGLANDLDPVGMLAQELVFQGRNVIVLAYPESTLGHISEEYRDKVLSAPYYEVQSQFFKQVINEIIGQNGEFELWSHSTGGPISADILLDSNFQERIQNAVLLSPVGAVSQSRTSLILGIIQEIRAGLRLRTTKGNLKDLAKYSFVLPFNEQERGQKKRKQTVINNVMAKICQQYPHWGDMKVAEGGKIVIWSAEKDELTKTTRGHDVLTQSRQATLVVDQEAAHAGGLLTPTEAIAPIEKILGRGL